MSDRLHDDLDDLARQVTVVDLRDRALRTARRRSRRNALLVSATVVAVLAGAGVVAWATVDRRSDIAPIGPTPTASATASPAPSVSPSPGPGQSTSRTDFAFPPLDANATHLGPWTSKPAPFVPGRVFMFSRGEEGAPSSISILADGQLRTSSLGTLTGASCIGNTYAFSPDGTRIAWVRGSIETLRGQLVMTELATRRSVAIADNANCDGGHSPKWSDDSRSIVYQLLGAPGDNDYRQTSLDTGQTTVFPGGEAAYVGVTRGNFQAYGSPHDDWITVEDGADNIVRTAYRKGSGWGWAVIGLSDDGRYVTLSPRTTDPARPIYSQVVLDTVTKKDVTPTVSAADTLIHVVLVSGGRLLVQIARPNGRQYLQLLAANGGVDASVNIEPGLLIQHYAP